MDAERASVRGADLGVGVRMISGKGSWLGLSKCDASDWGEGTSESGGVGIAVSEEGTYLRKSKRMKEGKGKRKRKSKSGEVGVGVRMISGNGSWHGLSKCDASDLGKGMSESGEVGVAVAVSEEGTESKGKRKRKRKTEGRVWKSLFPRDLKLYFPSTNVYFRGISEPDSDSEHSEHPIKLTYSLKVERKGFEIVKGRLLEEDVVSLLSNPGRRNYLVRNNGVKESVDSCIAGKYLLICCFKVPLPDNLEDAHACRAMIAAYSHLKKNNENFEMVMVAKMAPATMVAVGGGDEEAAFNHFFDAFPCLAIPFWDADSRDFLCMNLGLNDPWKHSAAIVVDPNQVVLQTSGDCFYTYGPSGFPYTDDRIKALFAESNKTMLGLDFMFNDGRLAVPVSLVQFLGSDILLSRFGGGDTISASVLTKKKCVILYLCMDGSLMKMLEGIRIREALRGRECEILVIPVPFLWHTTSFVNAVQLALERNKLSSWWVMPSLVGDEEATRRLWQLCDQPEWDALLFLSDGGKAVELNGILLIDGYERFEYPFTRMSLAADLFNRLRSVTLESLLPHPCINSDGSSVPVSQLNGSNVLLYLDCCKNVCRGDGPLYEELLRYYMNKISKDSEVEVVSVSLNCNCAAPQPWLVHPGAAEIKEQLFPDNSSSVWPALVAFGKDGFLLSREAQHHLPGASLFTDTLFQEIVCGMEDYTKMG